MDPWPNDDDLPQPFPPNAFDPVGAEQVVRLADAGELAAALPVLVGFRPRESVVLVALGGRSGRRLGMTARVDIPAPCDARPLAAALAARMAHERPETVLLAVVSEAPDVVAFPEDLVHDGGPVLPHRTLVHELLLALDAHAIPLGDALLVRGSRWWSYDCDEPCCAPGAGTPVPGGTSALEAAAVVSGQVLVRDREELELRIARPGAPAAAAMAATVTAVGEEIADLVLREGRDAAADEYTAWVDAAVARCGAGARPDDEELARVAWGLRDVRVRDLALGFALGAHARAAESLWTECTRRLPEPLDAAPATLLAVSVWLRGDGAMARIALDRALDSEPDYALADLLARGLDAGLGPRDLRAMVADAQAHPAPVPLPRLDDLVDDLMRTANGDRAAGAVRAGWAAATPGRGRARRGRRSPSRTRRPRSPE
jgi:hypothetical protein